jgi:hypothetical protein
MTPHRKVKFCHHHLQKRVTISHATWLWWSSRIAWLYVHWCGHIVLGMIDCVFSLCDKMTSTYSGVSPIYDTHIPVPTGIASSPCGSPPLHQSPTSLHDRIPHHPLDPANVSVVGKYTVSHYTVHHRSPSLQILTSRVLTYHVRFSSAISMCSICQIRVISIPPALSPDMNHSTANIVLSPRWLQ